MLNNHPNTLSSGAPLAGVIAGQGVSISGSTVTAVGGYNVAGTASGTVYTLTASSAAVTFGTTQPSATLAQAGTYLLIGRAYLIYNAATFAGTQTATLKLRRTNNTAADVTGATTTATLRIITTTTDTVGIMTMPAVIYTTTNTDDAVAVFGALSATPSVGSVDVNEASVLAIRLY